jgi:hypothetical protein
VVAETACKFYKSLAFPEVSAAQQCAQRGPQWLRCRLIEHSQVELPIGRLTLRGLARPPCE